MRSRAHVEEFQRAYARWQQSRDFPVIFYFCQKASAIPRTAEEVDQLRRVVEFRAELESKGLIGEYDDPSTFADIVRPHLVLALGRLLHRTTSARALPRVAASNLAQAKQDMMELAREYERMRVQMPGTRNGPACWPAFSRACGRLLHPHIHCCPHSQTVPRRASGWAPWLSWSKCPNLTL